MMSGRFRLAGTSLHFLMVISIPDNALAIVETSTCGLCGYVLRIVAFSSRRLTVGSSSTSMTRKSRISASSIGGLPPLLARGWTSQLSWYRRTMEYAVDRRTPSRSADHIIQTVFGTADYIRCRSSADTL